MRKDFKLDFKNKNIKIMLLIFLYLLAFYFLIFKNILSLVEVRELLEQEDIKAGKLNYERNIILKAFSIKKSDFEKDREKFENQGENLSKEKFDNIPALFGYIEEKIVKNNIIFQSFGRSRKDGDKLKLNMTFNGNEEDIKYFFKEVENENYDINFSSSYLKISSEKNLLEVKITLSAGILDKVEKLDRLMNNNIGNKDIFNREYKNPDKSNDISNSYMRIGSKKYYRISKKKELAENKDKKSDKENLKRKGEKE